MCFSTWGYTSLAVARWIHPRLHAAAAPQLRRLLNITPPKPDAPQVLAQLPHSGSPEQVLAYVEDRDGPSNLGVWRTGTS